MQVFPDPGEKTIKVSAQRQKIPITQQKEAVLRVSFTSSATSSPSTCADPSPAARQTAVSVTASTTTTSSAV